MRHLSEKSLESRFWSRVQKTDKCWFWIGSKNMFGYGVFKKINKTTFAHRFSFEKHVGRISPGMVICHKCDNRACVNPDHLFQGSIADNVHDAAVKNRMSQKLTPEKIKDIRKRHESGTRQSVIAREMGVAQCTISRILTKKRWRHL